MEKKVRATNEIFDKVEKLKNINRELANLEDEKKELLEAIKEFMNGEEADGLMDTEGRLLIGVLQTRGGLERLDGKRLEQELPEIYKKYQIKSALYKVFLTK